MKLLILNGPNLNLLGKRQPEIYGNQSFDEFLSILRLEYPDIDLEYFQSNHEGRIIDKLHKDNWDGIVMNPGGLAHTSVILLDAIYSISTPVIEVHISNVFKRESFRQVLLSSRACMETISGKGMDGYKLAIDTFIQK